MQAPAIPENEIERLQALYETGLLDTPVEARFERLTRLTKGYFNTEMVLISLVDRERQWFKSSQGLNAAESPRETSFCGHAILQRNIFQVVDALEDPRFSDNPLVVGPPNIRFYAGAPLVSPKGQAIGTLCLIDSRPRQLEDAELIALREFADCVSAEIFAEVTNALQQQLAATEVRYKAVVEGTRIGTWQWNVQSGAVVFNERWAEIVGYSLQELQPISIDTWLRLVHPNDAQLSATLLQRHFNGELEFYDCQCRMKHKEGHWVWVHDRGKVATWGADGQPVMMYGTHADITRQKLAESQLRESHDQYRSLVGNIPGVTYRALYEEPFRLVYLSEQVESLTGLPVNAFVHNPTMNFRNLILEEDRDAVDDSIQRSIRDNLNWQIDYRITHQSGEIRWVQERGRAIRDKEGSIAFLDGFLLDVTTEKLANEQVERQLEALSILHDIATNGRLSIHEQFQLALARARRFLKLDIALIGRIEKERYEIAWLSTAGFETFKQGEILPLAKTCCGIAFDAKQVVVINDLAHSDYRDHPGRAVYGMEAFIGIPIQVAGEPFGTLSFSSLKPRLPFDDSEIMFVSLLSGWIGDTIERDQTQARQRKLFSQLPGMVYQFQQWPDGRTAFPISSPGMRQIYRVEPDEVKTDASKVFEIIHPDDLPFISKTIDQSAEQLTEWHAEYRTRFPDGTIRWLKGDSMPERLSDGSVLWHGYIQDVTEHKRDQDRLEQSEARLRALFELSPLGIALNDYATGAFIKINDALLAPTGYTREEFVKLSYWQITPKEYESQEAQQLKSMEETGRYGPYVKEYIRKDGSRFPVRLNGMVVQDATGNRLIWSIIEDISVQVRQQQVLEHVNERFKLAADSARLGVWDYDVIHRDLEWDDWMYRLYGMDRTTFSHTYAGWLVRIHPHDVEPVQQAFEDALLGVRDFDTEFRIILPDGQVRHLKAAAIVSRNQQGAAVRVTGINYDITQSRLADRMKSEFVSTVSHELRTPLTSIAGALGLLNGGALGNLPKPLQEMISIAFKNSQRLSHLINDLLDMEKLVAGKMHLALSLVHLPGLLEQVVNQISGYAQSYGVSVVLSLPVPDVCIRVDPERVNQILSNFLSNAIKYSPSDGEVHLIAGVMDNKVRLSVIDQGPGIPESFRDKVFQQFAQADSSDTRQKGGTGLGLAISRKLADAMGGTVGFASEPGRGATFYVEFNREDRPA